MTADNTHKPRKPHRPLNMEPLDMLGAIHRNWMWQRNAEFEVFGAVFTTGTADTTALASSLDPARSHIDSLTRELTTSETSLLGGERRWVTSSGGSGS